MRAFILIAITLLLPSIALAHCQIPCGIYDDHARVEQLSEDVNTIEKAVKEINSLSSKNDALSKNQLVRWVMNKEEHAQKIIDTISGYFLTQRVKSEQKDYQKRLADHHSIIVNAMKVKQSVDKKVVDQLRVAVNQLANYYPPHEH